MEIDTDRAMMIVSRDWELPRLSAAAGIDERWLQSFVALRFADLLAQVAIGDRLHQLPPDDRAWFKAQCENLVADAVSRYDVLLIEGAEQTGDVGPFSILPEASVIKPVLGERVLLVPQVWSILTNPHMPDGNAIGKDPDIVHAVGARHLDVRDDDRQRPRWETFTSTLLRIGYGVMVVREGVLLEGPSKWDSGD